MTDAEKTEIRPAASTDAEEIAAIHLASRAVAMPFLPPQERIWGEVVWWIEHMVLAECRVWVAVRGAETVGFAALDGDMLDQLYLRPDVRRQGVGTLLLEEVRRHSPEGLSLTVFEQNTAARAFYERHGFTVLDVNDGSRTMENLPEMTLRWAPGTAG